MKNIGQVPENIDKLFIEKRLQMISLHGFLRGFDQELGRNDDTGGQTRYVWELASALAECGAKVDVFTRLIEGDDPSYAVPVELHGNARIIRVCCGGPLYIRKELLWPVLQEFTDGIIHFNANEGNQPAVVHGHYAESGWVAAQLAKQYGCKMAFTGHSYGIPKRSSFETAGKDMEKAEAFYHFSARIEAERISLSNADLVVCNSDLEIHDQVSLYGEYAAKCKAIPPGVSRTFFPYEEDVDDRRITQLVEPYLKTDLAKKVILAVARPAPKKNLSALVEAFGADPEIRQLANLIIIAGNRTDIREVSETARQVYTDILYLEDAYDLRGHVALPKRHNSFVDVPAAYRFAARRRGIFVNPALTEPFGLTLLEAAASGLPVAATLEGGPPEILRRCQNGVLIDPNDVAQISQALKRLLSADNWNEYSQAGLEGVRRYYSWDAHMKRYLEALSYLLNK